MTVKQKLVIGEDAVTFDSENGKTNMIVDRVSFYDRVELTIEDVEALAEFFNSVIRSYHVHEYRYNEVVRE